MPRNVTPERDPRDRFGLYRLCDCTSCGASGKAYDAESDTHTSDRCPDCRGEGRIREEVASCETPEAVGVALVTLAREGEWTDCPFGLLDREGETGKRWLVLPWPSTARTVRAAASELGKQSARKRSARTQ